VWIQDTSIFGSDPNFGCPLSVFIQFTCNKW